MSDDKQPREGYKLIYRPFITLRNGVRLYAWQKGLKAFAFYVPVNK